MQRAAPKVLGVLFFAASLFAYRYFQPLVSHQALAAQTALLAVLLIGSWWLSTLRLRPHLETIDAFLGDLCYPIYLVHTPVQIVAKTALESGHSDLAAVVALALVSP